MSDFEVERLVIEHLQKSLNALGELQQSYQHHYLSIIQTLLRQLAQMPTRQSETIRKRLGFLERLLSQPSLQDLETLQRGIAELQQVDAIQSDVRTNGAIIGDVPRATKTFDIGTTKVDNRLETIERNNERFALTLKKLIQLIDRFGDAVNGEERQNLRQQADLLLQGQRQLESQLRETRRQLSQVKAQNEQLNQALQRARSLSLTDELTGLPNRRALLHRLEEEIGRVQRHPSPLTLAIIDLDHFKRINDQHGHGIGDEVLRTYAKYILSSFRRQDHIARYGGEEFIVLLPHTDIEGAVKALTKIREKAAHHTITAHCGQLALPTFSAGVTGYHPGESAEVFISRADAALYRAKAAGRNRIEAID